MGKFLHHPSLLWQGDLHLSTWFNTSLAFKLETGAVQRFLKRKHILNKLGGLPWGISQGRLHPMVYDFSPSLPPLNLGSNSE